MSEVKKIQVNALHPVSKKKQIAIYYPHLGSVKFADGTVIKYDSSKHSIIG